MKTLWVYGWSYWFLLLAALDKMADAIGRALDEDWLAGAVLAADVAILLHMLGVW